MYILKKNSDINIMDNIEIANEIARLEAMYKHYKILYRKLMLLCAFCSNEIKVVKRNRDQCKLKLKQMRRLSG